MIVYQLRDEDDAPLYIGVTDVPSQRFAAHAAERTWWPDVVTFRIESLPTRREALRREAELIALHMPKYNAAHHPAPYPRLIALHMPKYNAAHHPAPYPRSARGFREKDWPESPMTIDLRAAGNNVRHWTEERDRLIREAIDAGGTLREIGAAVGLSHQAVKLIGTKR